MHLFQYVPAQSTNNAAATCSGTGDLWPKVLQPAKPRGQCTACSAQSAQGPTSKLLWREFYSIQQQKPYTDGLIC